MTILLKVIYRFNVILIKTPITFCKKNRKKNSKIHSKPKKKKKENKKEKTRITTTIVKKKNKAGGIMLPDSKIS